MAFDKRKSLQIALNYTQQGKWDRAITEYQAILKADPKDLTVCNNLGDLYARGGKVAEAIEQYQKLGELYRADGLSVKAIAVYKKIAKLDPSLTSAYQACADLYWEQGLVGEAKIQMATVVEHYAKVGDRPKLIDAYRRLVQFDPTNTAAIGRLADLLLKEGKQEDAAVEYTQAAQVAQAAGQTAEADRFLQKARKVAPRAPEENLGLAEALRQEGKFDEAEELLGKVTAANPENAEAWRALGEVQTSLGKSADAVLSLQKATIHGLPETAVAFALGQSLLQTGRTDEAIALCQRLSEKALALGDPDHAIACCRSLLAVFPQLIPLHAHLAALFETLGRRNEAETVIRHLAAAQEAAGQTEDAIQSYRRLLDLDPTDAEAQTRLEALSPSEPLTLEVVDLSPAATPEDAAAPPEEPTLVLEEADAGPHVETQDLGLSALEDLSLSFGKEEVTLLLEEPAEATHDAVGGPSLSVAEEGFSQETVTRAETEPESETEAKTQTKAETETVPGSERQAEPEAEKEIESASVPDWMSQGFEPLELEAQVPGAAGVLAEWPPEETTLVLEDIPIGIGPEKRGTEPSLDLMPQPDETSPAEFGASLETDGFPEEAPAVSLETVELPQEIGLGGLERQPPAFEEEGESAGQVAEQLAEAEVYQKYGLEEKARERLLEVLRLAPENLTARLGLKAIYLERRQVEEACGEILAIAQILRGRGNEDGALEEIREGLALAPANPDLQRFLAAARNAQDLVVNPDAAEDSGLSEPPAMAEHATLPAAEDGPEAEPSGEPLVCLESAPATEDDAPPPDVPLLLEFEEPAPASPGPRVDFDRVLGPPQEEELPTELRVLLDEIEERPTPVPDTVDSSVNQTMEDDVAEADFYLSQGMEDEARTVLRRMEECNPEHPAVSALAARIAGATEAPLSVPPAVGGSAPVRAAEAVPSEEPAPPAVAPVSSEDLAPTLPEIVPKKTGVDFTAESSVTGFVGGGEEPQEALAEEDYLATAMKSGPLEDGLISELQKGAQEQLDEKEYETHYNLGIAYKEMDLFDEAIQEFRLTVGEPKRALDSADLIGLCFLAKGQPEQAIQTLQGGLLLEGYPPEAYHNLRRDLGAAYEAVEDVGRALEQFEILEAEGARFPDIPARIRTLRGRLSPGTEPKVEAKPTRRKKKISFI